MQVWQGWGAVLATQRDQLLSEHQPLTWTGCKCHCRFEKERRAAPRFPRLAPAPPAQESGAPRRVQCHPDLPSTPGVSRMAAGGAGGQGWECKLCGDGLYLQLPPPLAPNQAPGLGKGSRLLPRGRSRRMIPLPSCLPWREPAGGCLEKAGCGGRRPPPAAGRGIRMQTAAEQFR